MGELAEDFRFMKELKLKERKSKEPSRFEYATNLMTNAGYRVNLNAEDNKCLMVYAGKYTVRLWPYTGWWSGKGVGSGRGIHKLLERLGK